MWSIHRITLIVALALAAAPLCGQDPPSTPAPEPGSRDRFREAREKLESQLRESKNGLAVNKFQAIRRAYGGTIASAATPSQAQMILAESRGFSRLALQSMEYSAIGQHDRALPIAEQVHTLCVEIFGEDAELSVDTLHELGMLHYCLHDFDKSLSAFERVDKLRSAGLGENHEKTLLSRDMLALVLYLSGRYAEAETLWVKVLERRREIQGRSSLAVAGTLDRLATMYDDLHNYDKLDECRRGAWEIRSKALGADATETIESVISLVEIRARYQKAIDPKLLGLVQAATERTLQRTEKGSMQAELPRLLALGRLHLLLGNLDQAEPLLQRAFQASGGAFGRTPQKEAMLWSLANLYLLRGRRAPAFGLLHHYRYRVQLALGPDHPANSSALNQLGMVMIEAGGVPQALEYRRDAWRIVERNRTRVYVGTSEREQATFAQSLAREYSDNLAMCIERAGDKADARRFALELALSAKGSILEAQLQRRGFLRQGDNPELERRHAEWRSAAAVYYAASMSPQATRDAQRNLAEMRTQLETAEQALARVSAHFARQRDSHQIHTGDVLRALPADSVLIEFVKYESRLPRQFTREEQLQFRLRLAEVRKTGITGNESTPDLSTDNDRATPILPEWKYGAIVVSRESSDEPKADGAEIEPRIELVNLGPAEQIERAIQAWREVVSRNSEPSSLEGASRILADLVWKPLLPALCEHRKIYLAPDASLAHVSFAALPGSAPGSFLVEDYDFAYLATGRDLATASVSRNTPSAPLLIGAPDFGARNENDPAAADPQPPVPGGFWFKPLSDTSKEVENIAAMLRSRNLNPTVLTGSRATESALNSARGPTLLHLATHGFFLSDVGIETVRTADDNRGIGGVRPTGQEPTSSASYLLRLLRQENPMYRSGIALSGGNDALLGRRSPGVDDGIVTAAEVAWLDLTGTTLVVISACESGVGEVRIGEGVFGLRRAFVLAGAENLVMSLWRVPSAPTRQLMESLYRHSERERTPPRSLLAAQREMVSTLRAAGRYPHPFLWAAFVSSGTRAGLR